tara:strand:+ start:1703 stop:2413 length:711 start_codon:yes stop_codon:yes gene_type:complete
VTDAGKTVQSLIASSELAIISAGFRCFTKIEIAKQLGIEQESLAFDSGFFPPAAVARMLDSEAIDLTVGHTACIKTENFQSPDIGLGIRFEPSTYAEIDALATAPKMPGINSYLDSTFGYYTLDKANGYVLAHYNWHRFGAGKGGRVHDVEANIEAIGALLTKRLNRIKQKCRDAKKVLMVVGETQGYRHMTIGDCHFALDDVSPIMDASKRHFGSKCRVVSLGDVATADMVLGLL